MKRTDYMMLAGALVLLAAPLNVQAAAGPAAGAAGAPAGAAAPRPPRPPPPAPVADLTGTWIQTNAAAGAAPRTMVIKQTGTLLESRNPNAAPPPAGAPPPSIMRGVIQGDQLDMMRWFDLDGGEVSWVRGQVKDGKIVWVRKSLHSAPNKWRIDGEFPEEFARAP